MFFSEEIKFSYFVNYFGISHNKPQAPSIPSSPRSVPYLWDPPPCSLPKRISIHVVHTLTGSRSNSWLWPAPYAITESFPKAS